MVAADFYSDAAQLTAAAAQKNFKTSDNCSGISQVNPFKIQDLYGNLTKTHGVPDPSHHLGFISRAHTSFLILESTLVGLIACTSQLMNGWAAS